MPKHIVQWVFWPTAATLVLVTTYYVWYRGLPRRPTAPVNAAGKQDPQSPTGEDDQDWTNPPDTTIVKTVFPRSGAMERITIQVGTVETDEVQLFAQVTGLLKSQVVNIGDKVKSGDLLATIDVPELREQVRRNKAVVEQAKAKVDQMTAKVKVAKADAEAEDAQVEYALANARAATAWLSYRSLQFARMKYLVRERSVEDKLEDEAKERYEAARESENAAKAAIVATKAKVLSAKAKIDLAEADVLEAKAQERVAEAELGKSEEQLKFAQIKAPFDGIITHRPQVPGSMVRSTALGGTNAPLLTIQRTDRMRVVVQIPDDDVPYADPGDPAMIEISALRSRTFDGKFEGKISRIAKTEDPKTRLMHVEIDLDNKLGKLRQGMFGTVTIILDPESSQLSIPSVCLSGKSKSPREGTVYVEEKGKAKKRKLKLGPDNGARVVVLDGLEKTDRVILSPPRGLPDGLEVQATLIDEMQRKDDGQQ